MLSIRYNTKETILLLYNSNIERVGRKEVMKLKSSLVVLSNMTLGFTTVKYPDLNCFLSISNIRL